MNATTKESRLHPRVSVSSICFMGLSRDALLAQFAALGPQRVSLLNSEVLDDPAALRRALDDNGWQAESVTHPFRMFQPLERSDAVMRDARDALSRVIEAAAGVGARSIYMLTGGHGDLTWEQAAEVFSEAVAPCVVQARAAGVQLAIENASVLFADNHIAHSLADTLTLAEMADIGVCLDIYGCWTDAGLDQLIRRALPRLALVQWSDYVYGDRALPCRAVPGDGALPLQRIMGWLLEAGYRGAFDLELIGPRIEAEGREAAVRRAAQTTGAMLTGFGA